MTDSGGSHEIDVYKNELPPCPGKDYTFDPIMGWLHNSVVVPSRNTDEYARWVLAVDAHERQLLKDERGEDVEPLFPYRKKQLSRNYTKWDPLVGYVHRHDSIPTNVQAYKWWVRRRVFEDFIPFAEWEDLDRIRAGEQPMGDVFGLMRGPNFHVYPESTEHEPAARGPRLPGERS